LANAYLLVSHGSRDPRPQMAIDRLIQQLHGLLPAPQLIASAQLELAELALHAQINNFASKCELQGYDRLQILPLFLISGAHAIEDIPAEVSLAREKIGDRIEIAVLPFLGTHAAFTNSIAPTDTNPSSWEIILAHGTRRAGGNAIVEELAARLDRVAAYWSVAPSLAERVAEAIATGANEVTIWPYFLFAGTITDAIAASVAELQQQYPQVKLNLAAPIGDRPELVAAIASILATDR
jgi:sirohydrochlorin cobaltochelatase